MITAPPPAPAPDTLDAVTSSPITVSTVSGLLLPLLVGLVTTPSWPRAAKGLMLAAGAFAFSAAAQMGHADALGRLGGLDWGAVLNGTLPTWLAAQSAHGSVWRHTALLARLQALGTRPPPDPVRGSAATIERAQGPTSPREPGRPDRLRPTGPRDAVRPRPTAPTRDLGAAARAQRRVRITRPPDVDPSPSGRHSLLGDDDGPPTLHDR